MSHAQNPEPAVKVRLEHIQGHGIPSIEGHIHADREYMPKLVVHGDRVYIWTGTTIGTTAVYRDVLATVVEVP